MSDMTAGSVLRAVRAAIFAAVCVTTAALGHALMSARPLPWWVWGAAFGATGAAAWWRAGRERGAFAVIGATVLAELGLHALFGLAQASLALRSSHPMDMGMGRVQPLHSSHGSPGMVLAHAVAALVCGWWLWRGEKAVFRLARSVAAALFAPLLLVLTSLGRGPRLPVRPAAGRGRLVRLRGVCLQYAVSRRGPPGPSPCC
ncbi:hypothetical protein [Streptomyces sp. BP-8]|uniref:Integral membrane protein n=1 Tax=Streptomyces sirii TaxID=3127701 RepID=A0ABZ2QXP7_9ACTN